MKSLEERHAEREKHRREGPEPVVIEKDKDDEKAADDFELNEKEPMRNKAPGSSREPPLFETRVVGDDSIPGSIERSSNPDNATDSAAAKASVKAAKTSGGAGVGNGGGAGWKPNT